MQQFNVNSRAVAGLRQRPENLPEKRKRHKTEAPPPARMTPCTKQRAHQGESWMKPPPHTLSTPDTRDAVTFQHRLEQFSPGVVWLDAEGRVSAFNDVALRILGTVDEQSPGMDRDTLFGMDVVRLHPARSRAKLRDLLQSGDASGREADSPLPAVLIGVADHVLMIKASHMSGPHGSCGTCMFYYDLTDLATEPSPGVLTGMTTPPRRLFKIPVFRKNRVILIDLKNVVRFQGDGHYTTIVTRDDRYLSNLSLADLELRLDSSVYLRVHRSHIVSLPFAVELVKADENLNLVMDDVERSVVPVSRSRAVQLKELLGVI
ncbi:LytTR family transcriptional regulator DNA-binding domain-containing protein [Paraburkholderia denitrificans]|uniref:LytTR family transcriptional regulator DNA-binding domain-containing protein n=1 Tax=Paraburkholderia denitrificans TaxID=694025 RepID=A0ABW0J2V3_9BURK